MSSHKSDESLKKNAKGKAKLARRTSTPIIEASRPVPARRRSTFTTTSSPWARRRSFLSRAMLSNDTHSVYELSPYSSYRMFSERSMEESRSPSFSVTLRESQGFIWNQDLFASQYEQDRVINPEDYCEEAIEESDEPLDKVKRRLRTSSDGGVKVTEIRF